MSAFLEQGKYGTGLIDWEGGRSDEGFREFKVKWRIKAAPTDGPFVIMQCPGLPAIGSAWNFGNDYDSWAFCTPYIKVTPVVKEETNYLWVAEQKFSSAFQTKRCQDTQVEDPLLEPQKVSGSFVKYTKEAMFDMDGDPIRNSAFERIRGAAVEFDANRPNVKIEQNVSNLELDVFSQLIDHVNISPLWGLPARTIKLSNASWERKIYGVCSYYYTRSFEFDVDYRTFDRRALDEGTKVLNGHWGTLANDGVTTWVLDNIGASPPDPDNPQHYTRYKDRNGENTRVVLNGSGLPLDPSGTAPEVYIDIKFYPNANFLVLGIPTSF